MSSKYSGGQDLIGYFPNENRMRSFSARKLIATQIFSMLLLPGMALAQANESDGIRESLSRSIQESRNSGHLPKAEKFLRQAVSMDEDAYGPSSRNVAGDLETLSDVFSEDGKFAEAQAALGTALAIYEVTDGPQVASNSYYLGKQANLAIHQKKFPEAEHFYKESLVLEKKERGFEDPGTLRDLAELYHLMKDYPNSEAVYSKIIESKSLEAGDGEVLGAIEDLCALYEEEGKFEAEESLYRNTIQTNESILPHGHLATVAELNDLGLFYERRKRLQEAENCYERALEQFDDLASDAGLMDSNLAIVINNYARLLRTEGRIDESEKYENRAKAIRDNLGGPR